MCQHCTHEGMPTETFKLHFEWKTHNRTDLKSPSTSESSQMSSWGTFLLFRRCSSLLFCDGGNRNISSCIFQQKLVMTAGKTRKKCMHVNVVVTESHWVCVVDSITQMFTFLSSTTTSVLCLLIVCGRDSVLTLYNKEF